jgi:succinate dehydrogenase / fumarate reductase, cytochrome b subunit
LNEISHSAYPLAGIAATARTGDPGQQENWADREPLPETGHIKQIRSSKCGTTRTLRGGTFQIAEISAACDGQDKGQPVTAIIASSLLPPVVRCGKTPSVKADCIQGQEGLDHGGSEGRRGRVDINMVMSIVHRLTGAANYFGRLLLAVWLLSAAMGDEEFDAVSAFLATPVGLIVLFGFTWSLIHHMLGGVRHFIWDFARGFELRTVRLLSWATLLGSLTLTRLIWWAGLSQWGKLS